MARPLRLLVARECADPRFFSALEEARTRAGYSRSEFARVSGVALPTLEALERRYQYRDGRRRGCRMDTAFRIVKALGLEDVDGLFSPLPAGGLEA